MLPQFLVKQVGANPFETTAVTTKIFAVNGRRPLQEGSFAVQWSHVQNNGCPFQIAGIIIKKFIGGVVNRFGIFILETSIQHLGALGADR